MVAEMLQELGYRLQDNRKKMEGTRHPDRNAQFETWTPACRKLRQGETAISVDTKKKELVGPFRKTGENGGLTGRLGRCGYTT